MDATTLALAFLLPLAAAGVWCGALALAAEMGWRALAAQFPGRPPGFGLRYGLASVVIRRVWSRVRYGGVVTVEVGTEGVGFSAYLYFSFRHPPIYIPYDAVEECESMRNGALLLPRGSEHRILIRGRAGRAVLQHWQGWREGLPAGRVSL